jgi:hypothetical protein
MPQTSRQRFPSGIAHARRTRLAGGVLLLLGLSAPIARAQDSPTPAPRWAAGLSVGLPGTGTTPLPAQLATLGVNVTQVTPAHAGIDISVGTIPYAVALGGLVFATRVDAALPMRLRPSLLLLPSAGISLVGSTGGGAGGLNAGLATILSSGHVGLRTGATVHVFANATRPIWLIEVGVVHLGT